MTINLLLSSLKFLISMKEILILLLKTNMSKLNQIWVNKNNKFKVSNLSKWKNKLMQREEIVFAYLKVSLIILIKKIKKLLNNFLRIKENNKYIYWTSNYQKRLDYLNNFFNKNQRKLENSILNFCIKT
jgi:hypothetical protein